MKEKKNMLDVKAREGKREKKDVKTMEQEKREIGLNQKLDATNLNWLHINFRTVLYMATQHI